MAYEVKDKWTWKVDQAGERILLANFSAIITKEVRYVDGISSRTFLTLEGETQSEKFTEIVIQAEKFASLSWITPAWGVAAVVQPGSAIKEDLRTAIQLRSKDVERKTIYTHTGWTSINGVDTYLHTGGGITKNGNDKKVTVELPAELNRYTLPSIDQKTIARSIITSLQLLDIGPPEVTWPLLAAVYRAAIKPVDFAIHITGRTGTYKSEIASLMQSHFGQTMTARNLPANWSSTANALEAQAYKIKNAIFAIDDFIPTGTSWQIRQYQKTADQLVRGQGNQAGRARLTDTSNLQTTMYPRGLILSTGEDTPEGHSVRARMFIIELDPKDIDLEKMTRAQETREKLSESMAHFIEKMAANRGKHEDDAQKIKLKVRAKNLTTGHSRTPDIIGDLVAGAAALLRYALRAKAITTAVYKAMLSQATASIILNGEKQAVYLQTADPVDAFIETLRTMYATTLAHARTTRGGIPQKAHMLGWTSVDTPGEIPTYKAHGPQLGWVDWETDELLLDASTAYETIKRQAKGELTLTKHTMIKRLREGGIIKRCDTTRNRNTVRVTCMGAGRTVIVLSLRDFLQTEEEENGK